MGKDFQVVADDAAIRIVHRFGSLDLPMEFGRLHRMAEIERENVEIAVRKIGNGLPTLKLRHDKCGEAEHVTIAHAVSEKINRSLMVRARMVRECDQE